MSRKFHVRFQVLTATNVKMAVFWDVSPCSLVDIDRRLGGACLHHQGYTPWWWRQSFFETSINICQTTRWNIPEDSHLHEFHAVVQTECWWHHQKTPPLVRVLGQSNPVYLRNVLVCNIFLPYAPSSPKWHIPLRQRFSSQNPLEWYEVERLWTRDSSNCWDTLFWHQIFHHYLRNLRWISAEALNIKVCSHD
jgi:hypothetical protein